MPELQAAPQGYVGGQIFPPARDPWAKAKHIEIFLAEPVEYSDPAQREVLALPGRVRFSGAGA